MCFSLRKAIKGDGERGARVGTNISLLRMQWDLWYPLENGVSDVAGLMGQCSVGGSSVVS